MTNLIEYRQSKKLDAYSFKFHQERVEKKGSDE